MCNNAFFDGRGFAKHHHNSQLWSVSKNACNLNPHGIFGSNFAYLSIITISSLVTGMQNGNGTLRIIFLAGQGILVKMLITLEPHRIY